MGLHGDKLNMIFIFIFYLSGFSSIKADIKVEFIPDRPFSSGESGTSNFANERVLGTCNCRVNGDEANVHNVPRHCCSRYSLMMGSNSLTRQARGGGDCAERVCSILMPLKGCTFTCELDLCQEYCKKNCKCTNYVNKY